MAVTSYNGSSFNFNLNWASIASLLAFMSVFRIVTHFYRNLKATRGVPGLTPLFGPLSFWGAVLGTRWWNPGLDYMWNERRKLYHRYGTDTISFTPIVSGMPFIMTANVEVARQIVAGGSKSPFYKPEEVSTALLMFGHNVATAEGENWRRHRRILNPAFTPLTFSLVWKETMRIYYDMMHSEGWSSQQEVYISSIQAHTYKLAFFVITSCAFGLPFAWTDPPRSSQGFSIQDSLRMILDNTMIMTMAPKWIFKLPIRKLKDLATAKETLTNFMNEQVALRRKEMRAQLSLQDDDETVKKDVFSRLTRASEQDAKAGMNDQELIGNVFVMLFAGHETTANTLAVVMGFLGIYQDFQEEAYQQIKSVCGDREPAYEDYAKLDKVLACFLEALRLFPSGSLMIRKPSTDTTLIIEDTDGSNKSLHLKKGAQVVVDVIGLEYNPKHFPEPDRYLPSRWYVTPTKPKPTENFTAFSFGPRVCIGQNFSKTEAVCFLALLLRDWRLDIKLKEGESREEYRERVMNARFMMTLAAYDIPIVLKRREG